ncbi:TPA: hypothetical protein VBX77_001344 [Yersinia enterocolitica]|nr:hypothetical protein [Yersinia enterocolitica]
MKKFIGLTIIFMFIFPNITSFAAPLKDVKAAFIREGNIWLYLHEKEKKITTSGKVIGEPQWSYDGQYVAYQTTGPDELTENQQEIEIWIYDVKKDKKQKIFHNGYSSSWAPKKNILAFTDYRTLDLSDLKGFFNIELGVDAYQWFPKGNEFILSTSGNLEADGWKSAKLYKKSIQSPYKNIHTATSTPFFTLPKEVGVGESKIIPINASDFTFSPSSKWISFIASTTASIAMDSNMLCVISNDGKKFEVVDEIIWQVGKPKWAPSKDTLAYIEGGGRLVFGLNNKKLKTKDMPVSGVFTPKHYADLDFDWLDNESLVVSRIPEAEWNNDLTKQPRPTLYTILIKNNSQKKITNPAKGYGDYQPKFIPSIQKITWFRGTSLIDDKRNVWMANPDGSKATEWLKNVESIAVY